MMELDPSLIEIAGEDDSLLQQIPTLDNYYFLCSPLQISGSNRKVNRAPDSPIMVLKDNVNVEKSTCSSAGGSINKENINANKPEVTKLSVEPQQMKRKKRDGAYNLRKSLAWDRAFFTEEGVLNPLELSILSGSFSNSRGEVLPSIHEEQRNVASNSFSTSDSAAMQGMPKMLSNRKSTRTGSKGGGCPRPLINSSLKRPANASTTKVSMKESKLPKLPVSRPSAHSLPISSKSIISTSHSKQNQTGQEADIFQKSVGLQGSSKTLKSSANKGNSGSDSSTMAAKSSCQPPRRNMTNVALEVRSSTNSQPTLVTKAKCGLDAVLPRPGSRVPNSLNVSRKSGIPTAKPSGLRMPSPSLGFFAQTNKSSASKSSSGKATPPSNLPQPYTPSLQRFNTTNYARDSKLLHARGKIQNVEDNQEVRNFIDADKGFQECGEAHKDASSHKESDSLRNDTVKDTKMNYLENIKFAPQHSFVVLPKNDGGMNDTIKSQHIEDKPSSFEVGTHAVIFESVSEYAAGDTKQDLVVPHNDDSSAIRDLDEYSRKKAQPLKASSGEADQILYGDNHNFVSDDGILLDGRNSFDSQRCQRESNANVNLSICETNISENLGFKSSPRESAENESAVLVDPSNNKLHVEDVQAHFLDTANDCYDDKLCTSGVHGHHIECDDNSESSGESLKPPSCCLLVEQPSELNHGFLLHDISLLSEGTPAEEFHGVLGLEVVLNDVPEKGNYFGCNPNRSNVLITQDSGATQVGGVAVHEMVEQPQEKAAFSSPSRMISSVENCGSYSDTQFGSDLSLKTSRDHLAVDTCDSIGCSLNKEEETVANALKNNILAENCNLTSNDGILLEGRNSFDSQRYQKENVANVMSNICETNKSEKLSSKSPPSESSANESAPGVDLSNDKLQVEDVQVHFRDTISLTKCCDYKLHISEVHDQDIECDDDNERSGQPLKPPSCCLLVEQPSEVNHGFLLHDYSLLPEGTPVEEFHGVYGLKVALNDVPEKNNDCGCKPNRSDILITQDPGATQVGGVALHDLVEQPQEKATPSSPLMRVSSIESCESYSDTQFGPDLSLKKSRDHLAVDSCDSIVSCSLNKEEETVANAFTNNIFADNCNLTSNDGILLEGRNSFDSQRYQKKNVATIMSNICETNKSEKLSSKTPPSESPANESALGVDPSNDKLQVEDVQVHFLDSTSLAKCCDYKLDISEVHDQDIECDDDSERSGQPLKPPICYLLVEQPSEVNHVFLLHDYSLLSEGTHAEEFHGVYGLEVALNDIPEKNNGCGCKPNQSNILITQDPGAIQVSGVAVHEMVEQPQEKAAFSGPSRVVSSVEICESYSDTQFGSDLSFKTRIDHLEVDTCNSIVCSLNKEEETVANALKNNILVENCNLTSNDGILLEGRNSFDSQRYQKENVANVMSIICETNKSEKLSSKSPPNESAANESAPGVDPPNDKLQVEDVQVHFLDTTPLAKCCDYKLHISDVHDQDIECDDDCERFGQPLKPPSCCLLVEQPSEVNHVFLLHDYSLLSEGTPAEEFHGVYGLEVALNDIPEKNKVAGVAVHEMVEQPQEKAAPSSPSRKVSSVEHYESYSDAQFGPDLSLKKSRDHLAVDSCDSIVCCSLNKEEETVANAFTNNILADNCNLMSNDGILLDGRNSFDSQRYQKENVANVMSSIRETNNSEKLSSKSLPSAPGVDPSNDKLHVEDLQVHFLDTTSLAKCCDYNLHISEVHDQDVECDDNSERCGQPLKPPSYCVLVEQPSEVNHDFLLHDYSLLSEGTPVEEFHGVYGLEVALNDAPEKNNGCGCKPNRSNILIAHDPGATKVGGIAVHEMVEQPQEKAALSSPSGLVSSVENCECYNDTQCRPDLSLKRSRDYLAADTCDSIVCFSLSKEEETVANAFNNILEENTETKFSSENPRKDNEITNLTCGILFWGSRSLGEFHSGDGGHSTDGSLLNQNCSGSELERSQSASLIEYSEQANEDATGIVDKTTNELCSSDTEVQSLNGNLLVGSSNSGHSNSTMDTQCVMVAADVNGQSELQMPILVFHNGFEYNHGLHLNDYLLHGKSTNFDETQEENVLTHVPFVQERNDDDCSESKTFSVAIQVPLSIQDSGVDMVGMPEHQPVEHAQSSSLDDETSTEYTNHSTDTILGNDMVFSVQATSSESDLAVMIGDGDQPVGEITNKAFCLREESGFSDQKIQTLANETDIVNLGVEIVNAILLDDFGVEISQINVSPTGELQHKMDNAICLTEDEDRTVPIKKSRDGGKKHNLLVNTPINAVPFSDEWLAAMEAAGEDVLTIKSGAVQNSPTDRSLPEPGPWSPVKRKHDEIGPFDCTKFNIPPPDSD